MTGCDFVNRIVFGYTHSQFYFPKTFFAMQTLVDGFGSGALATATDTGAGPVGTIIYVIVGVSLFIGVAGLVVYAIKKFLSHK